jgi:hypothetical protein
MEALPDESEFKALDFSSLKFPSDKLTVATLRRLHPDLFDLGFSTWDDAQPKYFLHADKDRHLENGIAGMLFDERLLVACAYAEAKGIEGPGNWSMVECQERLVDYYRHYHLATGVNHALELVRDVERQGRSIAQQQGR